MKKFWNQFCGWKGWKRIFPLGLFGEVLLFVGCCAGLLWVFGRGLELWWPAYVLYAVSAYSLTALCIRLPGAVKQEKRCLVCLLTAAMGVYMIRRANREIKTLQEKTHGESFL